MEAIKTAVIGIGNMGTAHACTLAEGKVPGLTLAAVCDTDPARLADFASRWPGVACYPDVRALLAAGCAQAAVVAVPHPLHSEIAEQVLEAGLHVLVEKPIDVRLSRAKKLCARAAAGSQVFAIMLNQRTNPLFARARAIVQGGELGALKRSVWVVTNWYRTQHYYDSGDWRATWAGEGGGVLLNQAPHNLDLWQWICGIPSKVYAKCLYGCHRDIVVENDVTVVTQYPNGATGSFITCTHDAIGTDRLEIDLDAGKIVVEDSKKATIYRMKKSEPEMNETMTMMEVAMLTMGNAAGGLYETEEFENTDGWGFQHTTVMENFALHILEGAPLLAPGSDGINGVNLANAIQLSSWLGKEVDNPVDPELYAAELNKRIEAEGKFPTRD